MPVFLGGSTNMPLGPPNVWTTPTDGFPGSPTVAMRSVTTPRFAIPAPDEPELGLVVPATLVVLDDLPPQAAAPTESATNRPTRESG